MQATFTTKVNIRSSAQVITSPSNDIGDLFAGDKVYGTVTGAWIGFNKVYRVDGGIVDFPNGAFAAVQDPNNSAMKYAVLQDVPEPTPNPEPVPTRKPLRISFDSDEFDSLTVIDKLTIELNPKP